MGRHELVPFHCLPEGSGGPQRHAPGERGFLIAFGIEMQLL